MDTALRGIRPLPFLVSLGFSTLFLRSGLLSFLFLVPLGFTALTSNSQTAWAAAMVMAVFNGFLTAFFMLFSSPVAGPGSFGIIGLDILVIALTSASFLWIMIPPMTGLLSLKTPYRIIIGSILSFLVFLLILFGFSNGETFNLFIESQTEALLKVYTAQPGNAAAESMERFLNSGRLVEIIRNLILRGGGFASCLFLLTLSREIAFFLAGRYFKRRGMPAPFNSLSRRLAAFHADFFPVWILSFSLPAVLVFRLSAVSLAETAAWNVLFASAVLFLAQGTGILFFFVSRLKKGSRFFFFFVIISMFLSPGINVFFLGALTLLGIAENWLPLRVLKIGEPSSTPED
ncbi:MAG: hypothetical protein LBE10_13275 [Treponema sp.]|jgi:hypothetical protein|nr:hypothetical protein [Treponema sp.]